MGRFKPEYFVYLLIAAVLLVIAWGSAGSKQPGAATSEPARPAQSAPPVAVEGQAVPIVPEDVLKNLGKVVVKRLSATDTDLKTSHQHEINGVAALREAFGAEKLSLRARLVYFGKDTFTTDSEMTWYNAAKNGAPRWRLYYKDNPVIKAAKPGDSLFIARYGKDDVLAIVAPRNSAYEARLFELFQIGKNVPAADLKTKTDAKTAVSRQSTLETINKQLQQTGKVPVEMSIWKDVESGDLTVNGKVEKVKDGDTFNIAGAFDVRLLGIDAPEHKQTCKVDGKTWNCGEEAASYLSSLILGKTISCVNHKKEKYGRFLSVCTVGGKDVNRAMVERGLAVIYFSDMYAGAERKARMDGRGLWNSEFINPEDFRHMRRASH